MARILGLRPKLLPLLLLLALASPARAGLTECLREQLGLISASQRPELALDVLERTLHLADDGSGWVSATIQVGSSRVPIFVQVTRPPADRGIRTLRAYFAVRDPREYERIAKALVLSSHWVWEQSKGGRAASDPEAFAAAGRALEQYSDAWKDATRPAGVVEMPHRIRLRYGVRPDAKLKFEPDQKVCSLVIGHADEPGEGAARTLLLGMDFRLSAAPRTPLAFAEDPPVFRELLKRVSDPSCPDAECPLTGLHALANADPASLSPPPTQGKGERFKREARSLRFDSNFRALFALLSSGAGPSAPQGPVILASPTGQGKTTLIERLENAWRTETKGEVVRVSLAGLNQGSELRAQIAAAVAELPEPLPASLRDRIEGAASAGEAIQLLGTAPRPVLLFIEESGKLASDPAFEGLRRELGPLRSPRIVYEMSAPDEAALQARLQRLRGAVGEEDTRVFRPGPEPRDAALAKLKAFFESMQVPVTQEALEELVRRTGGWPAQLGRSLKALGDALSQSGAERVDQAMVERVVASPAGK